MKAAGVLLISFSPMVKVMTEGIPQGPRTSLWAYLQWLFQWHLMHSCSWSSHGARVWSNLHEVNGVVLESRVVEVVLLS